MRSRPLHGKLRNDIVHFVKEHAFGYLPASVHHFRNRYPFVVGCGLYEVHHHLPASTRGLAERLPQISRLDFLSGALHGANSFNNAFYGGPCPPRGQAAHNYRITVYALDMVLDLPVGISRNHLLTAMQGHILAQSTLTVKFDR
ncbi:MAG: YbhB/YbcL family Raf kinase inhibitor-like protein [Dehalococcoidia bacterium]|nr:YbhB/YbcL family Raf kinase inhibitor-like protein [Dehalococcoidia bacterium]